MLRDVPIKFFLIISFILCGLIPLMVMALMSLSTAKNELKEQAFRQLESVRNIKKNQIEYLFETLGQEPDLKTLDRIMNERSAMGKTGETYLVGNDFKMRSDSYLEPESHSVLASKNGTLKDNGADTPAVRKALSGKTGREIIVDYRGNKVLSAYAPIMRHDKTVWAILAEIDEKEIDRIIDNALNQQITIIFGLSLVMVIILALLISTLINKGILNITQELEKLIQSILSGKLYVKSDRRKVFVDFTGVADKVNQLIEAFLLQTREKRKLEEVVQYNQRMESIGTLAGGIAHDFNNILSYMMAYADLVYYELEEGTQSHQNMSEIITAMDRASDLTSQIMTFSRQMKREKKQLLVNLLVKEAIKLLNASLPKHIQIEKNISKNELYVLANPTQIHQIMMNLCTNAFHSMQKNGGTLSVYLDKVSLQEKDLKIAPAGTYCCLKISDTGTGIEEEVQQKMFEPFYTTKAVGQGTGMGLSVVHGIIKQLNGTINVDTTLGQGTSITVYLPLVKKEEKSILEHKKEKTIKGTGKILFIDDEKHICLSNQQILNSLGYTVDILYETEHVKQFLRSEDQRYNLIITDVNMPDINGFDIVQNLRAKNISTPILMITGYSEKLDSDHVKMMGASELLYKPFSTPDLSKTIAKLMQPKPLS